jgi:hypothetical protein
MMDEIESFNLIPVFYPNLILQALYDAAIHAGRQCGRNAAGINADGPLTCTKF